MKNNKEPKKTKMKNIAQSAETFTAYATIDAGYYMMKQLQKKLNKPISPLEAQIDKVTGFDANKKYTEEIIDILEDIISAKKVIEADYSNDEKTLNELLKLM